MCKTVKPLTEFYKKGRNYDGYQISCKECFSVYMKNWRDNRKPKKVKITEPPTGKDTTLMMIGVTKQDYCEMYRILSKIGYNPELDIFPQFAEKWSLNVSNEPRKGNPNQFTYKDCKE